MKCIDNDVKSFTLIYSRLFNIPLFLIIFFTVFFFSGVVYLQYGDEIKRAMLPAGLQDMSQVQTLFTQTFPDKVKRSGDNRKTIYIKDNSCGVFYELDSVG